MKKFLVTLAAFALLTTGLSAQLTGTKNVPGDYPTLAAAITALNAQGVGAGGVTINLVVGNPQTAPAGGYVIGGTGSLVLTTTSAANQVILTGNNNTITAFGGQTSGAVNDAIFKLIGADFVTLDGLTMQENPANLTTTTATNNMTEWGVALLYANLTDGAQNNTIKNCTISLNRTYLNTFGIYSNTRHSATAVATSAEVTAATGSNSNNKVYANTISNVNYGIVFIGAGTTIAAIDSGNDIGGASAATGNTITNWGGGPAASSYTSLTGSSYCIFVNQQINDNVSFNTITSAALTQLNTCGGILKNYSVAQPNGTIATTINSNVVTVTNNPTAATTGGVIGINNQGLTPLLSTATMSLSNNTVQNCVVGGSTSTTNGVSCITNLSLPGTMNMTGNSVLNNAITASTATSGIINGIATSGACGTLNITNNVIRGHASTSTSGQPQGITNSGAVVTAININNNQLGNASGGFFTSAVVTSGPLFGISTSGGASTCALSIQNNDLRGISYMNVTAVSAPQTYIQNSATTLSQNISNNTFTNLSVNTTGSVTFISDSVSAPAGGFKTINGNSIVTGFNKGGAGGTVTLYNDGASSTATAGVQNNNNNFSNLTVTGGTTVAGWFNNDGTGGTPTKTITGNTFTNWTCGTSPVTVLQSNFGNPGNITGNTIGNITGQSTMTGLLIGGSGTVSALNVSNNSITGLSSTGAGGAVTGLSNAVASTTTAVLSGNTINNLSSASTTGTVAGIATSASSNVSGNTINTLSCIGTTSGVTNGIMVTGGAAVNVFKNKIYDLATTGAFTTTPGVNGIVLSGAVSAATVAVYNNLIGDLRSPAAISTDAIRGLSVTATGTTSAFNLYYNTVNFSAASSGTNFGTSGVFHAASATATTAALNLRNNVISNASTPAGTGTTVAFRRSTSSLANYVGTSNNNDFYAGPAGPASLIFTDGTSSDQTIAPYQARVASRDAASFSEIAPFLSTVGGSPDFLHMNPNVATQIESGGVAISGITDDFDGNIRNASTPDVGADEFSGIPTDLTPPAISYTPLGNGAAGLNRTLTATITDASGVPTAGGGLPTLYYAVNGGAFSPVTGVSIGGSQFTFTFGAAAAGLGDVVTYYIVAQDTAATPNVGAFPSGGATGFSINPPAASTPPTTPSSYTTVGSLSGSKTVGSGGDYPTLTAAVGALNTSILTGPVVLTLIDASYSAGETFPLVINANSGSSPTNTITFKPAVGNAPTITGSAAADCVITINGGDYVIIDGSNTTNGTSRDLTIVSGNATTSGSAVLCLKSASASDGATNNQILNTNVIGAGSTATLFGIFSGGGTPAVTAVALSPNSNNTIRNNRVIRAQYGIFAIGASTANLDSGLQIVGNNVGTATSGDGSSIGGIDIRNQTGAIVAANDVQNVIGAGGVNLQGINLQDTRLSSVSGNAVHRMSYTGTGTTKLYGMTTSTATFNVVGSPSANTCVNNAVYDLSSAGAVRSGTPPG